MLCPQNCFGCCIKKHFCFQSFEILMFIVPCRPNFICPSSVETTGSLYLFLLMIGQDQGCCRPRPQRKRKSVRGNGTNAAAYPSLPPPPSLRAGEKRYTKYIQWPRDRVWSIIWKNYHSKIPSFSLVGILLVCWEMCIHTVQCTYTVIQVFSYCKFLGSKIWGGKLLIFI